MPKNQKIIKVNTKTSRYVLRDELEIDEICAELTRLAEEKEERRMWKELCEDGRTKPK